MLSVNWSQKPRDIFWSCPRAQNIWKCSRIFQPGFIGLFPSFLDLLWKMMLDDCEENILALVVTIAWSIWTNCNEVRNGGKKKGELELLQGSCQYLQEYVGAKKLSIKAVQDQIEHWCPPLEQMYKVNVDGAVFSAKQEAGIGIVAWDCHGLVMAAMSMKVSAPLGPLEVEAKAFEAGLQFAKYLGIQDFILEADSLNVYRALAGLSHAAAVIAPIIYRILDSCHDIRNVRFSHVKRKGNSPAHLLAKHACGIVDYLVWMEENSCFLEQALHHDVISFLSNESF